MKTALSNRVNQESTWHYFWIAALTAALALAMTVAAGAEPPRGALSDQWRDAVEAFRAGDGELAPLYFDRLAGDPADQLSSPALIDQGLLVWKALAAQAHGARHWQAEECWQRANLAPEAAHWRHVALASLYLEQGLVADAAEQLDEARRLAPDNGVVHYFTGLLRLEQAASARDWPDAVGRPEVRFAVHVQTDVAPNTRSMYLLAASQELERAIETAAVDAGQPLVAKVDTIAPDLRPTVADLLVAAGADRYQIRAHHVLSSVYVERGLPALAERHLDLAAQGGATVLFGYSELAAAFEQEGDYTSAGRAYIKAAEHGDSPVTSLRKAWQNFRQATQP